MRTRVSIVIPCYNAGSHVGEAIESALSQTYANVEVIVVDDGSTDDTLDIVRAFAPRIRWRTGPNRGAPAARNAALAMATGSLIQFLDADDVLDPRKLEVQAGRAMADIYTLHYCDRVEHPADRPELGVVVRVPQAEDAFATALEHVVHTSGPVYQKELLDRVGGYREDLPNCQDYELHLRLALAGCSFVRVPEVLFTIRRNRNSISSDVANVYRQMVRLWVELLQERPEALTTERRIRLACALATKGRWFLRHGLESDAAHCFALAADVDRNGAELAYGPASRLTKSILGRRLTEQLSQLSRHYRGAARTY